MHLTEGFAMVWHDLRMFLVFAAIAGGWMLYEAYCNEKKAKKLNKKDENDSV